MKMTRLSCCRFCFGEVRLWMTVMTYNLGSLRRRLVKTGTRLIKQAELAEGHLTRRPLAAMVYCIAALPAGG